MVDTEPKRPLTSGVADDIGASFGVPGDNRPHAQREQISLEEGGGGYQRDDHEYRSRHGGGGGEYEGGEGGRMRQKEDDPLGNAAMTLTALSSGVRDLERSASRSGFQGFSGQQTGATERGAERSQTERGGESMTPSYSERPLRDSQETFADATIRAGGGQRQQHQQQQEQQQRQQSAMQPLALPLPLSAAITPSSSSSALNISTLTASESTSPISAQEEVVSRDTPITPQGQHTLRAPGGRMQSLSHMLKDRLSLVPFRAEQGWDRVDVDMSEPRITREEFREPARRDDLQHYHDYHERLSPSHQDELSAHPSRLLRDRPKTPSASLLQGQDRSMGRQQWELSHDSRSQQHQRDFQQRLQLPPQQQQQQQQMQQPHHRTLSSSSIRDDKGPFHWMTQIPLSPIMDPIVVKPKRKYTKKSSLLPQARAETHGQVDLQTRQENNELLYSDRGLILKTQIPKKGRPISKHSTTSSQSTPNLTSLGILPASHHYFSKAGTPSSSSSSAMSSLVAAAAGRSPSDSTLSTHSSSSQGAHPSVVSDQRGPVISPTGRRPGRPPSNPSLPRHAHSQSYSSGPSISFPPPHSGQARPLASPTAHEFDLHFTRYKDPQTPQELDDNRFSAYEDRSPTLSIATTASSQPSFRHHQLPEYQVPTSRRRYVSSPIDQVFSGENLEHRNVEGDPRYPEQWRMTVDAPSAMPPRSFAEGVTAQMNTLKRSSSGMQKSLSMDGHHSRSIENRRMTVGGSGVGGGGRGTMGYGTDGQFEDVNEETGSNFFDEEFDDSAADARSKKRTSGSDLDYSGVDGIGIGRVGNADGGSVRRSVNQKGGNKTWHGITLGSERRRPRSLVLPRGRGEPALPWTNMLDSGLGSGSRSGSGSMVGVLPGQRHLEIDDDEIDYHEMMILTPAIAPGPPSPPPPAALPSSSNSLMILGGTRGKGRGGRSMHSHAQSLDISSFSAPSHHGHRPLSPSKLDHPSRHDMYSTKELLPEQQRALTSGRRLYASSSRSDQGIFNMDTRGIPSSTDHRGYNHLDTTPPPPIATRADILAREMMSGTHSIPSGGSSGRGRGQRGSSHGHNHLKAAVVKRSTSRRGPGPHLKKHQILQQQLYQIQRDQEEMDLQMALQLQQRQMQQQQQLEQEQEQERQGSEQQRKLKQQKQQQQQRRSLYSQRHQHSQSLQLQHEFSSPELNLQQQQQEQQVQPRPGRPTKQRVLLRSESAMAILHVIAIAKGTPHTLNPTNLTTTTNSSSRATTTTTNSISRATTTTIITTHTNALLTTASTQAATAVSHPSTKIPLTPTAVSPPSANALPILQEPSPSASTFEFFAVAKLLLPE
ncbi:hypothetical protein KI688_011160 [Linnemannia hyalina]|uniref:Uncharacterized protein n=1 Tax=Linnemannia hyalina TaxID=64524 RepID=A0A9P7XXB9_9FUNG|nr:hypothetical protein KI688_011160 [Linnemannia hyalina]